jgi:hypothetical protein
LIEDPDWYATPEGRRQTQREFERALRRGEVVVSAGSKIHRIEPGIHLPILGTGESFR